MALSMQEKQLLDNYIIDKLNEFIQCNIDHFEISDLIGTNVPVQMSCPKTSIRSSLERIDHSKVNKPFIINYVWGRPTYDFVPYDVVNIETDTKIKIKFRRGREGAAGERTEKCVAWRFSWPRRRQPFLWRIPRRIPWLGGT